MNQIRIRNILNHRDGSVAFIEFVEGSRCKILSKKNFEKRYEVDVESEVEKLAS